MQLILKGMFLSEGNDVFVITPNRPTFFFPETKIWILMIFKDVLASKRRSSCPYKPLSFQILRHPQFLSNFQSPKFKFFVSGKKNVHLLGVMTKTSLSSDKKVPLWSRHFKCHWLKHLWEFRIFNSWTRCSAFNS